MAALLKAVLKPVAVIIEVCPGTARRPVGIAIMLVLTNILQAVVEAFIIAVKILAEADVRIQNMATEDARITTKIKAIQATLATVPITIGADIGEE